MAKALTKESLSTQLYHNLRTALMDGQYAPGQRLTISGIATEYGTSITPVREAIFRLVSERALEMRAATSVQVPNLGADDLREIQKIRIELEGLAAYTLAERITAQQLNELKTIHKRFIKAAGSDAAKASLLNRDFHFAVIRMAQMPILEDICENMWTLMGPFLRLFHDRMPIRQMSEVDHKHHELLEAFEARDPERSRKALQEDIRWGEELIRLLEDDKGSETVAAKR